MHQICIKTNGKSFEIIDFDNTNQFSYSFTYIDNTHFVTNEPNYNKNLTEYYNQYLKINDFLLYDDMLEIAKHTSAINNLKKKLPTFEKFKQINEDDSMFKKTMTNIPNFILNVLLNNQPFCKFINKDEIFNSRPLDEDISPLHIKNRSNPMIQEKIRNYERQFTICVGKNDPTINSLFSEEILYNNLETFFNSTYSIFIGYIHLGKQEGFFTKKLLGSIGIEGHENIFIIDKKRKILIKYEPRGVVSSMFNFFETIDLKDYFFKLLETYDKHKTCNFKNFVYSINGYVTSVSNQNNYTYIDTSTIDSINYPYPDNKKSKDYHFPQYHDKKKGGFKTDTNCQTYALCASLLYCMNPTYEGVSKYKDLSNDVKKYYDNLILLTKYGITKERVKLFRENLNTQILPMIIGDKQDDTEIYMSEMNNSWMKNNNLTNTDIIPKNPTTNKRSSQKSNPTYHSNNEFVVVNNPIENNNNLNKKLHKKPTTKKLLSQNPKHNSNSNNEFVVVTSSKGKPTKLTRNNPNQNLLNEYMRT